VQRKVGGGSLEHHSRWPGDRPLREQAVGFLFGQLVAEPVTKFLCGEGDSLVEVRRVAQGRQRRAQLGQGQREDALDLSRVDRDGGDAEILAEELLGKQAAEGVPDDDRLGVQRR
jgi:hypothetical protein